METFYTWVSDYGYVAIFFLLVFGIVGLPIPDETLLTFAGYLVYKGHLNFAGTLCTAFLGSVCGITTSYLLGRTVGLFLIKKYGWIFRITQERLDRVHRWFERVGKWILPLGYFMPGVRHLSALVAGSSKLEWPVFALFAYSGGFVWSLTFISIGYFLGEGWTQSPEHVKRDLLVGFGLIALCVAVFFIIHYKISNRQAQPVPEISTSSKPQETPDTKKHGTV